MTFEEGETGPEKNVTINKQDIARYAGASGDFNRVHVDEEFAKEAGYPRVIAMGMLTAGVAGSMVNDWFGVDSIESFNVRFEDIVLADETITASGRISDVSDQRVTANIEVTNQDDERVLSGQVTVANNQSEAESE